MPMAGEIPTDQAIRNTELPKGERGLDRHTVTDAPNLGAGDDGDLGTGQRSAFHLVPGSGANAASTQLVRETIENSNGGTHDFRGGKSYESGLDSDEERTDVRRVKASGTQRWQGAANQREARPATGGSRR